MRFLKAVPVLGLSVLMLYATPTASAVVATKPPPDPSCQTNGRVWAVEFSKGVMYIGGAFTNVRPAGADPGVGEVPRNRVAACRVSDGKLLSWNPNANGIVYVISPQPALGRVYLGGSFTSIKGRGASRLAAVSPADPTALAGSADSSRLLGSTPAVDNTVRAIERGPNGNIFIGGHFNKASGLARAKLAQFTPTGSVVSWAPKVQQKPIQTTCPPRCLPKVFTIDFGTYKDPKTGATVRGVYFGGHFGLVNGADREQAAAVDLNDGKKVLRFNPWIYNDTNCPTCSQVETHRVYNLMVHNSKAYMCGGFWVTYTKPNTSNPDAPRGNKQPSFNIVVTDLYKGWKDGKFGAGNDGDTPDCEIHEGVLYLGGHFGWAGRICSQNPPPGTSTKKCTSSNSTNRLHVEAVDVNTGWLLCWDPRESSKHGPWSVGHDPAADVFGFAGEHKIFGGKKQQGTALYRTHANHANPSCVTSKT